MLAVIKTLKHCHIIYRTLAGIFQLIRGIVKKAAVCFKSTAR